MPQFRYAPLRYGSILLLAWLLLFFLTRTVLLFTHLAEADIGVAGGHGVGIIFKKGKIYRKVSEEDLLEVFLAELKKMEEEGSH